MRARGNGAPGVLLLLLTLGAAAGCGRAPATHTVTIEAMRFQPQSLTVAEGDTIVWVNKDLVPHTATSKGGGFDSQTIAPEGSWRYVVTAAGDVEYVCTFHPTMMAKIVVD